MFSIFFDQVFEHFNNVSKGIGIYYFYDTSPRILSHRSLHRNHFISISFSNRRS